MWLQTCLLLCLIFTGGASNRELGDSGEPCEPDEADTCFTSVSREIKYMLDLKKSVALNITKATVLELCLALEDSLNCTFDIVDSGCSASEGKASFITWLKALRETLDSVCDGAEQNEASIKDLLLGVSCWNLESFILCAEKEGNLTHIRDLLHTPINDDECRNLHHVVDRCYGSASQASCREQDDVSRKANDMLDIFFSSTGCEYDSTTLQHPGGGQASTPTVLAAVVVGTLIALLAS